MFNVLADSLKCTVCGNFLVFDAVSTGEDYALTTNVNTMNILDKVDDIINKYLVYKCTSCDSIYRYTYKDIERFMRKTITEAYLTIVLQDQLTKSNFLEDKFMVYCNKCKGLDGQGSCPKSVFDKCEIKRFPVDEL
jgi:hypothetical protein